MSGALDAKARKTAKKLIEKFGRALVYRRRTAGGVYDPATGTRSGATFAETNFIGLVQSETTEEAEDTTARQRSLKVIVPAASLAFTPLEGDQIKDPGESNKVYLVTDNPEPLRPGDLAIFWRLNCRASA